MFEISTQNAPMHNLGQHLRRKHEGPSFESWEQTLPTIIFEKLDCLDPARRSKRSEKMVAGRLKSFAPKLDSEQVTSCLFYYVQNCRKYTCVEGKLIALVDELIASPDWNDLLVVMTAMAPKYIGSNDWEDLARFFANICKQKEEYDLFLLFMSNLACSKGHEAVPIILTAMTHWPVNLPDYSGILSKSLSYCCNFVIQEEKLRVTDSLRNQLGIQPDFQGLIRELKKEMEAGELLSRYAAIMIASTSLKALDSVLFKVVMPVANTYRLNLHSAKLAALTMGALSLLNHFNRDWASCCLEKMWQSSDTPENLIEDWVSAVIISCGVTNLQTLANKISIFPAKCVSHKFLISLEVWCRRNFPPLIVKKSGRNIPYFYFINKAHKRTEDPCFNITDLLKQDFHILKQKSQHSTYLKQLVKREAPVYDTCSPLYQPVYPEARNAYCNSTSKFGIKCVIGNGQILRLKKKNVEQLSSEGGSRKRKIGDSSYYCGALSGGLLKRIGKGKEISLSHGKIRLEDSVKKEEEKEPNDQVTDEDHVDSSRDNSSRSVDGDGGEILIQEEGHLQEEQEGEDAEDSDVQDHLSADNSHSRSSDVHASTDGEAEDVELEEIKTGDERSIHSQLSENSGRAVGEESAEVEDPKEDEKDKLDATILNRSFSKNDSRIEKSANRVTNSNFQIKGAHAKEVASAEWQSFEVNFYSTPRDEHENLTLVAANKPEARGQSSRSNGITQILMEWFSAHCIISSTVSTGKLISATKPKISTIDLVKYLLRAFIDKDCPSEFECPLVLLIQSLSKSEWPDFIPVFVVKISVVLQNVECLKSKAVESLAKVAACLCLQAGNKILIKTFLCEILCKSGGPKALTICTAVLSVWPNVLISADLLASCLLNAILEIDYEFGNDSQHQLASMLKSQPGYKEPKEAFLLIYLNQEMTAARDYTAKYCAALLILARQPPSYQVLQILTTHANDWAKKLEAAKESLSAMNLLCSYLCSSDSRMGKGTDLKNQLKKILYTLTVTYGPSKELKELAFQGYSLISKGQKGGQEEK